MIFIELEKKASRLEDFYKETFKQLYGMFPPQLETQDKNTLNWLANEYKEERVCRDLIKKYLTLNDEWLKSHGYPVSLLRKSLQAVIVNNAEVNKQDKPVFVVNYTLDGTPIVTTVDRPIGKFKPVLWDEWLYMGIADKLQFPKESWELAGNCVDDWIELWKKEGFLINHNITHNPSGKIPDKVRNYKQQDTSPNKELSQFCLQVIKDCSDGKMTKAQHSEAMSMIDVMVNSLVRTKENSPSTYERLWPEEPVT